MANQSPVRIGHCVPDAPDVDVHVDGEIAFERIAFTEVTDYAGLSSGSHEVTITAHGESDPVIETTLDLDDDTSYTVLATGMLDEDDIAATVMMDDPGTVADRKCHARFIHASPDAPAIDIRVAGGGPTLFENVSFREASEYTPVDADTYDIEVCPAGSDDIALSLPTTTLDGGSAITAIAVGLLGDDSLSAVITEDATMALAADD
ncbi:DUF4397 domain-containing protein [Halapricum sp. CBA1109]|uniref:DUF4397 domain-containing protein n=1 Tax=Halapricum sp. CBA1109 TaxID=2668068 RepID=UPI0012F7BA14|nr:DUF4397 domain-containing protein [Halapricum sp. CBA1109]MUV88750.1 DUF4397 domain-containing protein [Halapricum sp. CBA1109]